MRGFANTASLFPDGTLKNVSHTFPRNPVEFNQSEDDFESEVETRGSEDRGRAGGWEDRSNTSGNKDNGSSREVEEPGVAAGLGDPSTAAGSEIRGGAMGKMGTSRGGKTRELVEIGDSNQTKLVERFREGRKGNRLRTLQIYEPFLFDWLWDGPDY